MPWKLAFVPVNPPLSCSHVQLQVCLIKSPTPTFIPRVTPLTISHINLIVLITGAGLSVVTYLNSTTCAGTNRSDVYPLGGCASTPNGKALFVRMIHFLRDVSHRRLLISD
jgi:hypothetical protein